jgi:HlyD family secretion protein
MTRKTGILLVLLILVFISAIVAYLFMGTDSHVFRYRTTKAALRDIKVVISTNGIIEPVDPSEVYAPIDAFIAAVPHQEGTKIEKGRSLMRLESREIRAAIAEATSSLLQAKRQAQVVLSGPQKEEVTALDASIAECKLQLEQLTKDLQVEESLLAKQATTRATVESMRKQRDLLQLRLESLEQKKKDLPARYSAAEKKWEQDKINALTKQVFFLEQQLQMESIPSPKNGVIYSLAAKPGSYATKGQLLAQIYEPGKIRLRAYVDEPDLGRITKGLRAKIEWYGMPNQQWTGVVEKPAEQVVALNNRSIGNVLCSITSGPKGLIPNLNVKVEITTDFKANALVVPRSAIFSNEGKQAVLLLEGKNKIAKPVELGLITSEEIEILHGINAGDTIILNPNEVKQDE